MSKVENQRQLILEYCHKNNGITTAEANDLCEHFYYCNHAHYVSEILSRMVKAGLLIRESKGKYKLGNGQKAGHVNRDKSQTQLF